MTSNKTPLPPLNPETDPAAWRRWRKLVEAHAVVTKFSKKTDEEKAATSLMLRGLATLDLHESLPFAVESEKSDLPKTLDCLEAHFVGNANVSYER